MEPTRSATEQEKALAGEKEKLAEQLEQLQRQLQQQEQATAATQPDASSKLRKALSDAEQKELALRMQKDAEWLREGYGDRNIGMEDSVTAGLDQLSRELRDIQQALKSGNQPGQNGQTDREAQTLAQVRALREELERRSQQGGQQGQQGGQQKAGQQGQQGQQGGEGQQGGQQNGQSGDQGRYGAYSPLGGGGATINREGLQNAIGDLYGLRGQIDPHDRALYGYINGALGYLRNLYGADPSLLDSRINHDAVASLERLEVELNKRVAQRQANGTRTGASESAPEKYRDAVAEYFKKLSK